MYLACLKPNKQNNKKKNMQIVLKPFFPQILVTNEVLQETGEIQVCCLKRRDDECNK